MSRTLPARPSLTQLKQQAKDLLNAYRAGDLAARQALTAPPKHTAQRMVLADAQRAIAREYGFASWPKLKQHLDQLRATRRSEQSSQRRARQLAERQRVQELLARLTEAAAQGDLAQIIPALQMANRDLEIIRPQLVASGHHTLIVGVLLQGVVDRRPSVRYVSAQVMDHFADERCVAPLRQLLHDPVPRVRRAALHSLACEACKLAPLAAGNDLVPTLIDLALRDPSIRVRRVATYELGQTCPDARAQAALAVVLAQETDRTTRRHALAALARQP